LEVRTERIVFAVAAAAVVAHLVDHLIVRAGTREEWLEDVGRRCVVGDPVGYPDLGV
jgi:hypothetical protein